MTGSSEWQRLSPITLAYFLVKSVPHLVNMWPALLPLLAGGESVRNFFWTYGIVLVAALLLISTLLSYWFFRYQIAEDHIQLRSGVLNRRRLTLYFDRVQQADIAQPFYFRPFGLAILGLESAGSTQQEVDLPGLAIAQAEALKAQILAFREQTHASVSAAGRTSTAASKTATEAQPDYALQLPWQELARYGLMHNGLLLLIPLFAPLLEAWLPLLEAQLMAMEGSQLHQKILTLVDNNAVIVLAIAATISAIGGMVAVYTTSALIAVVRYWNYQLTRVDDQYQYRAGLLTVKTRGFRLHKLQLISVQQGIVARWLKRCSIVISKAGVRGQQLQQDQLHFLIPAVTHARLLELKQQLGLPETRWRRVHPFYIAWTTFFYGTLYGLLTAGFLFSFSYPAWLALLLYPIIGSIAWRRWWCLGFFQDDHWIALRSGFIGRRIDWLPIVKIQTLEMARPPWLRAKGLVNLQIRGATASLRLPCLYESRAVQLRDESLLRITQFRGRWL